MRITIVVIRGLVDRLNEKYADRFVSSVESDYKEFLITYNTSYDYPYQLNIEYKVNHVISFVGDRMNAREMYYYLKGLLGYGLPFY